MFGTLYEPPSLTFSGLFLLFALQIAAIFCYKQAQQFYRSHQLYQQYGPPKHLQNSTTTTPGPAGSATAAR